jgi:hypothetical protein
LIDGDQDLEASRLGCVQQASVFQPSQFGIANGLAVMFRKQKTKAFVNTFVN